MKLNTPAPVMTAPTLGQVTPQERIKQLEAERDRLREAMEFIAEERDAGRHDGLPEPCAAHDAETMFAVARAALEGK
jgi:hypothetical protein